MAKVRLPTQIDIKTRDGSNTKDSLVSNAFNDKSFTVKRPAILAQYAGAGVANGVFYYGGTVYHWDSGLSTPTASPITAYKGYVVYDIPSPYSDDFRWVKVAPFGTPVIGQYFTNSGYPLTVGSTLQYTPTVGTSPPITSVFLDNTVFQYKLYFQTSATLTGTSTLTASVNPPIITGYVANTAIPQVAQPCYWDENRVRVMLAYPPGYTTGGVLANRNGIKVGYVGPPGTNACAWDINDTPHLIGTTSTARGIDGNFIVGDHSSIACYWDSAYTRYDLPHSGAVSIAYAISGSTIVGEDNSAPCKWTIGGGQTLLNYAGYTSGKALAIDGNLIVGYVVSGANPHACYWDAAGTLHDLHYSANPWSTASGISNGIITGTVSNSTPHDFPVYWDVATLTPTSLSSFATLGTSTMGISGDTIIGIAKYGTFDTTPCYWYKFGAVTNLSTLGGVINAAMGVGF
jgi:hypothetical protein